MSTERIQKVLASAGIGSRRACELCVLDGRVRVNGHVQNTLPVLVDPEKDRITVDGKPIRHERLVYYILNKPKGVFCTHNDQSGRKRAVDLMVGVRERVYPVGRLDAESMGLLIMTNDGDLVEMLTHPRNCVPKTYRVQIDGNPSAETLRQLQSGVWMSEGKTAPAEVSVIHREREKCVLEITLRESKNREVQRLLARLGHKVRRIVRIRMGKLSITRLPLGAYRSLTEAEIRELKRLARQPAEPPAFNSKPAPRRSHPKPARGPTAPPDAGKPGTSQSSRRSANRRPGGRPVVPEKKVVANKPSSAPWRRRVILPEEI